MSSDIRPRLHAAAETAVPRSSTNIAEIEREARRRRGGRRRTVIGLTVLGMVTVAAAIQLGLQVAGRPEAVAPTDRTHHQVSKGEQLFDLDARMCQNMVSQLNGDILEVDESCSTSVLVGGATDDRNPALSPTGNRVAFIRQTSPHVTSLMEVNLGTRQIRSLATGIGWGRPVYSPDGRTIAFTQFTSRGGSEVYLEPSHGGTPRPLTTDPDDGAPAWSPDGSKLAVMDRGGLAVVDVASGKLTRLSRAPRGISSPFWGYDGGVHLYIVDGADITRGAADPYVGDSRFRFAELDPTTGAMIKESRVLDGAIMGQVDAVSEMGIRYVTTETGQTSQIHRLDEDFEAGAPTLNVRGVASLGPSRINPRVAIALH